jgi:hypothetical protein
MKEINVLIGVRELPKPEVLLIDVLIGDPASPGRPLLDVPNDFYRVAQPDS